jgi:hypothetical protein
VAAAPPVAEGWLRRRQRLLRPLRRAEAKARADSPVPLEPAEVLRRCDRVRRRLAPRRRRLLWSRRSSQQRSRSRSLRRLLVLRQGLPLAAGAPRPTRRSLERLLAAVHRGQQPAPEHPLLGADGPNPWYEAGSVVGAQRPWTPSYYDLFSPPSRKLPRFLRPRDYQRLGDLGMQLHRSAEGLKREMRRDRHRNFFRPPGAAADEKHPYPGVFDDTRGPSFVPNLFRSSGVGLRSRRLRRLEWERRQRERQKAAEGRQSRTAAGRTASPAGLSRWRQRRGGGALGGKVC